MSETPRFTPAHRETLERWATLQKEPGLAIVASLAEIDRLTTLNETLHLEIMKLRNTGVER